MFGISAFAQAPFSSLGQGVFAVTVSESVRAADTQSCIAEQVATQAETVNLFIWSIP